MLDTDADGVADQAAGSSAGFTISRGSGDLVLTGPVLGDVGPGAAGGPSAGDLDDDGHSDLVVSVGSGDEVRYYAVLGSTPDGTYPVTDKGVLLTGAGPGSLVYAPGDVDGDGQDDLVVAAVVPVVGGTTSYDTLVYSGADIAAQPAGAATGAPLSLGARFVDLLPIDDARTMVAVGAADDTSFYVTTWFAGAELHFTTGGQIVLPSFTGWPGARFGDAPDGRTWLLVEAYGPPFDGAWAWRTADLCGVNG